MMGWNSTAFRWSHCASVHPVFVSMNVWMEHPQLMTANHFQLLTTPEIMVNVFLSSKNFKHFNQISYQDLIFLPSWTVETIHLLASSRLVHLTNSSLATALVQHFRTAEWIPSGPCDLSPFNNCNVFQHHTYIKQNRGIFLASWHDSASSGFVASSSVGLENTL